MSGLAISTKADLRDQVQDFMADEFDVRELDRAIAFCEAGIRRRLRVLDMEVTVDLPITGETLTVPSRFLSARRLYIPGNKPLVYYSVDEIINHQIQRVRGRPSGYTLEGREDALPFFRFAPTPDSTDYVLRLTYLADMKLISDTDCNDLLERSPDIYFYGTAYHMIPYVRNAERFNDIGGLYQKAMLDEQNADNTDKIDGSVLIARPSQVPA